MWRIKSIVRTSLAYSLGYPLAISLFLGAAAVAITVVMLDEVLSE